MVAQFCCRVDSPKVVRDDSEFVVGNLRAFLSFISPDPRFLAIFASKEIARAFQSHQGLLRRQMVLSGAYPNDNR